MGTNQKYMNFDDLICQIDFIEYIVNNNYKLNKNKSTKTHKVFENKEISDAIIITKHRETNNYAYRGLHNSNDKGNIINFELNRINNTSNNKYLHVNKKLHKYLGIKPEIRQKKLNNNTIERLSISTKENQKFNFFLHQTRQIENFSYLLSRGLSIETLKSLTLKNRIIEAKSTYEENGELKHRNFYNTAFPLFHNSKIVGLEHKNNNYSKLEKYSDRSNGMWCSNFLPGISNTLVICEQSIDAISHHQLFNSENLNWYKSTAGQPSLNHFEIIDKDIIDKNIKHIKLANDNDTAGQFFNLQYLLHFTNKEFDIKIVNKQKDRFSIEIDKTKFDSKKIGYFNSALQKYNNEEKIKLLKFSTDTEYINNHIFRGSHINNSRIRYSIPYKVETIKLLNDRIHKLLPVRIKNFISMNIPQKKDWNEDLIHTNELVNNKIIQQTESQENSNKKTKDTKCKQTTAIH